MLAPPPPPSAPAVAPEQEQIKEVDETNNIQSSNRILIEHPLQFDTRNQNIPLEQIIQDNPFFPIDLNNQVPENNQDQSNDPSQYLQTFTVINSSRVFSFFFEKSFIFYFRY